jgi:hypothetical protein
MKGEECGLELPLVRVDGEVSMEEGEEKLEA